MERRENQLGFTREPGPGTTNRSAERRGHRVVQGDGGYQIVPATRLGVFRDGRGPGRYSGRFQPRPAQA